MMACFVKERVYYIQEDGILAINIIIDKLYYLCFNTIISVR